MPKGNRPKQRRGQEVARNKATSNRQATGVGPTMPDPGLISGVLGARSGGMPGPMPPIQNLMPPTQMPAPSKVGPAMPPPMTRGNIPGFVPPGMLPQVPMSQGRNEMMLPLQEQSFSPGVKAPIERMFKGLGRLGMY